MGAGALPFHQKTSSSGWVVEPKPSPTVLICSSGPRGTNPEKRKGFAQGRSESIFVGGMSQAICRLAGFSDLPTLPICRLAIVGYFFGRKKLVLQSEDFLQSSGLINLTLCQRRQACF